jgi:iron complex outermembrane receptor protein
VTVACQQAFARFDLRLGWEPANGDWTAAILAKNVTDERTISRTTDVPLFSGTYYAPMERPRSVALQFGRYFN